MTILFLIYVIAGYWATGQTIYANKIIIYTFGELFWRRFLLGMFLGWLLIPVALLKAIFVRWSQKISYHHFYDKKVRLRNNNIGFQYALNSEIYVDKSSLIALTNSVVRTLSVYQMNWYRILSTVMQIKSQKASRSVMRITPLYCNIIMKIRSAVLSHWHSILQEKITRSTEWGEWIDENTIELFITCDDFEDCFCDFTMMNSVEDYEEATAVIRIT